MIMKPRLYKIKLSAAFAYLLLLYLPNAIFGQNKQTVSYKEHFVNAGRINLHYLDFGGTGLPIIFLQSFHGDAKEWVDYDFVGFAPRFVESNRVFAITRRGWGKSDDPGWGYDIATQSVDAVAFMDALKLDKAIMIGRTPANMDITWIAEHHPNRLAGIIYIGNPYLYLNLSDTLVQKYVEMEATQACDLGNDANKKSLPRSSWRPHFLFDAAKRIQIPALIIIRPRQLSQPARELMVFYNMMKYVKTEDFNLCDKEAQEYYKNLSIDSFYQQKVKEALFKAYRTILMNEAVERAFDSNLKTITIEFPINIKTAEDYNKYWLETLSDIYYDSIKSFINLIPK